MIKLLLNRYFPSSGHGGVYRRQADWEKLGPLLYVFVGLFAFGHNYVNYPIADKQYVRVVERDPTYEREDRTVDRFEEQEINQLFTGAKAAAAGLLWPAYAMVLINEEIAK